MNDNLHSAEQVVPTQRSWATWLIAIAALALVVGVVTHLAEGREFVQMLERAHPAWLLASLLLQLSTYVCQAVTWRIVLVSSGESLSLSRLTRLSLAQLFVDQAIPSATVSGSVFIAKAFSNHRLRHTTISAAIIVGMLTDYVAYIIALLLALVVFGHSGHLNGSIAKIAIMFLIIGSGFCATLIVLAKRGLPRKLPFFERFKSVRTLVEILAGAKVPQASNLRLLAIGTATQLAIFVLDSASLWTLLASVGVQLPASFVFAAFMLASLARTLGFLPGGLGTFEAVSIGSLTIFGAPLASALAATLLFRGVSFWLPMVPGMIFARQEAHATGSNPSWHRVADYCDRSLKSILEEVQGSMTGLTNEEAVRRAALVPNNAFNGEKPLRLLRIAWNQVKSPLVLILFIAAAIGGFNAEWADTALVMLILVGSATIGFWREYTADTALRELRDRIRLRTRVLRSGEPQDVPISSVVPGDVVLLNPGSLVPGDALVLEATGLFVDQAIITGESFPVEKIVVPQGVAPNTALANRDNSLFFGTNVRSGVGRALVVRTGKDTEFGDIARQLSLAPPETEFDRGLRGLGNLLLMVMFIMVILVFMASTLMHHATADSLMFAVALAVGLSPELLPAILSVNLARSSQILARSGVLVRHLNAIENLGSMDVLCTDKTGTLTEGTVELEEAVDADGQKSSAILALAITNARNQGGLANPLDDAILKRATKNDPGPEKLGEVPYDFVRKRLSVVVRNDDRALLITKGALEQIISVCQTVQGGKSLDDAVRTQMRQRLQRWSDLGIRVLGVATRQVAIKNSYGTEDEVGLEFQGFLTFTDQPKAGIANVLRELGDLGVEVKVITGDNRLVARHIAQAVGIDATRVVTGEELDELRDEALWSLVESVNVFAQVDPNQKERIILALKKRNRVVGYMGDGVNDTPAMHAADASISVDSAADVAKSVADFVLLEKDLAIIARGVRAGRETFANTMKYILMTTSANLGNMISMAFASLFLPFLPLLAGQILLNNFLSDLPAIGLANDEVDPELVSSPRRWDIKFIGRFMVEFGLISSLFDFMTFGVLLWTFHATTETFRTAWFIESLLTELAVVFVLRTRRVFMRSTPSRMLVLTSIAVATLALLIPYLDVSGWLGFVPLPAHLVAVIIALTAAYVLCTEIAKYRFYQREATTPGCRANTSPVREFN